MIILKTLICFTLILLSSPKSLRKMTSNTDYNLFVSYVQQLHGLLMILVLILNMLDHSVVLEKWFYYEVKLLHVFHKEEV